MSFLDMFGQSLDKQWHGVYRGVVLTRKGTQIQAQVPQVMGTEATNWASPLVNVGTTAPAVGTLVGIVFMGGDINYPYYTPLNSFTSAISAASVNISGTGTFGKVVVNTKFTAPDGSIWNSGGLSMGTGSFITADTGWHNFSPLSNSWSATGGFAKYRLTPMNELQISASILSPASSTVNGVTIATFPAGYRPASTHGFPVATSLQVSTYSGTNSNAMMTITSGGVLQSSGVGGNTGSSSNVYFEVKIPLDV